MLRITLSFLAERCFECTRLMRHELHDSTAASGLERERSEC